MKKIVVVHSSDLLWKEDFYNLLRMFRTSKCEVFLPQDAGVKEVITKDKIKECDLIVAEVSFPSIGAGIELGLADAYSKKIYCFHAAKRKPSAALNQIACQIVPYQGLEDLGKSLQSIIE